MSARPTIRPKGCGLNRLDKNSRPPPGLPRSTEELGSDPSGERPVLFDQIQREVVPANRETPPATRSVGREPSLTVWT